MNAPTRTHLGPLWLAAVALMVLAGWLIWMAGHMSGETTSWAPISPGSFTDPSSSGPAETQAAVMVAQLEIMRTAAVPTPRPTLIPYTPAPTVEAWTQFPNCQPGLAPGSLCQPKRPKPPTPTPEATCPAYPTWISYCAMPGSDADTYAEVATQ